MVTSKEACGLATKNGQCVVVARDYREAVNMASSFRHYIRFHDLELQVNRQENTITIRRY